MTIAEKAVEIITAYANDNSYGYDQEHRWGTPDFDCSSLVISVWEKAGVPVKTKGASYTGNMCSVFRVCGFADATGEVNLQSGAGLIPGDVLLNTVNHTAMYVGNGRIAQARINELGTIRGGRPGDQTGQEIAIRGYYNYPWDYVLRYRESVNAEPVQPKDNAVEPVTKKGDAPVNLRILRKGDEGEDVRAAQILLIGRKHSCGVFGVDGDFGSATDRAVKNYQTANGLEVDGEIGSITWSKLLGV